MPSCSQHALQQTSAAQAVVIALLVMAIAGMASADEHAVGAVGEGIQHKLRIDASRAHHAHHPHVGGVLDARSPGQVRSQIGAPGAEEAHDARLWNFAEAMAISWEFD